MLENFLRPKWDDFFDEHGAEILLGLVFISFPNREVFSAASSQTYR
jgi:hypothetical protein